MNPLSQEILAQICAPSAAPRAQTAARPATRRTFTIEQILNPRAPAAGVDAQKQDAPLPDAI